MTRSNGLKRFGAIRRMIKPKWTWRLPILLAAFIIAAVVGGGAAVPDTAEAHYRSHRNKCPTFHSYQYGTGGIYTSAGVGFRPSDLCGGRHVKQAWVRIVQTGPAWRCQPHANTGYVYTGYSRWSHSDTWQSARAYATDSTAWRCQLKSHYNYWYY